MAVVLTLTAGCVSSAGSPNQKPRDRSVPSVNADAAALHGQRVSVIGDGAYSFNHAELWGNITMQMHGWHNPDERARECLVLRGALGGREAFASGAPRYRIVGRVYVDKPLDQPVACNSANFLVPESIEPLDLRTPVPRP